MYIVCIYISIIISQLYHVMFLYYLANFYSNSSSIRRSRSCLSTQHWAEETRVTSLTIDIFNGIYNDAF